jgi:hypothetical protein
MPIREVGELLAFEKDDYFLFNILRTSKITKCGHIKAFQCNNYNWSAILT